MIKIRMAMKSDIEWILSELKKFSQFFGSKHELYNDGEYAVNGIEQLILKHVFLIAENHNIEDSDIRVGFICGLFSPHMLNPSINVLIETFWWVSEEHRGCSAGIRLLNAFEKAAEDGNADWITFTLEAKSPVNEKTLTNRGFALKERNYVKEL